MAHKFKETYNKLKTNRINKLVIITLRIIVGAVFIFSGFVKAIDVMGSVYKFQEYIAVLNLTSLTGSEVVLAFAISILELTLGVLLLTGCQRRTTPLLLLAMMAVMLPLTYFLATTGSVADCGCFGDAVKLTNWQTFWKNVAITLALIYLLLFNRSVPCIYGPIIQWVVILLTALVGFNIAFTGYNVQPLIDFRPYKVGTNIGSQLPSMGENDYIFIYEKDGKQQEFSIDSVPDEEDGWTFIDRKLVKPDLTPAKKAEMNAFTVYEDGNDITEEVLDSTQNQLLVLIPDLPKLNRAYAFTLNDIANACSKQDVKLSCITSSSNEEVQKWYNLTEPDYPFYGGDDSEIKMLARGNPAVVYVEHGVVKWKRTFSSLPAKKLLKSNTPISKLSNDFEPAAKLWGFLWPYLLLMVALLFVNRIYPVINYIIDKIKAVRHKEQ